MPASSFLTPQGRTRLPGVFSEVTPVGVPLGSPGAKILLLIGEGVGGEPGVLKSWTRPASIRKEFRDGDLRTAALMAFDPARDSGIPGRPPFVFTYKTNPALKAAASFGDGGGDVLTVTSRDWGDFANRIGVDIALGTAKGRKVTVTLDEKTESWDDVGGDAALGARYVGEAGAMALVKADTGLKLNYTQSIVAVPWDGAQDVAGELVEVFSAAAYDDFQKVTVYGTTAGDTPASEVISLAGAGVVAGAVAFDKVTAVRVDGATAGIITVRSEASDNDVFTVPATLLAGITGILNVISTDAADTGINVLVKGRSAEGNAISEVIALNGVTEVDGLLTFAKVLSAEVMAAHAGTVSVRQDSDDTAGFSMAAGTNKAGINVSDGLWQPDTMFFDGKITHSLSAAAGGEFMVVRGIARDGSAVAEYIAPTAAATLSTADFVSVSQIEIGAITAGRTLDIAGTGADITIAKRPKLRDAVSFLNGLPGVTATNKRDSAYLVASLDSASQEIKAGAEVLFAAVLADVAKHVVDFSKLATAVSLAGAGGAPSPTASRVYLSGGADGTTTMDHWRAGIAAAKALSMGDEAFKPSRMATVALSDSAPVHALAPADLRDLDGKHERMWFVGLASSLDKAGVKDAIAALNHRGCQATPAQPVIYNDAGDEQTIKAWGAAVLMAAGVCGSPTATPMTDKVFNALRFVYNAGIDPVADAEELVAAGAVIFQGRTLVRGVTTYRDDDNPFFTEQSTNESLDDSVFNMRRALRPKIGAKNFDGLTSSVRSLAIYELQRQIDDGEIKSFNPESVVVDDLGDAFDLSYEVEPIEPLNFIGVQAFAQRLSLRL